MKRRDFLKSSALLGAIGALPAGLRAEDQPAAPAREYYELRAYHLRAGTMAGTFDNYMYRAAIPAFNRAGISPVGVFNVLAGPETPTAYVLLPCLSFDALAAAREKLLADKEYLTLASNFLDAAANNPSFIRFESSFLRAFACLPKLETPLAGKSRVIELRTYESASERQSQTKLEMFNAGEVAIFRRAGLQPVFFGDTIFGGSMPCLTYGVAFPSLEDREKNWQAFNTDPEWKKLSAKPEYVNVVSNTTNIFLQPRNYSQV